MKVNIKTEITNEKGDNEVWTVFLDQGELVNIVKAGGVEAGNQAIDGFVSKFTLQFKQRLSAVLNK